MDGWITIGTKLDTKSFEKQIDKLEGRLEEIDFMLSKPKEFGLTESDIAELTVEAEKLTNQLVILRKKQDELNNKSLNEVKDKFDGIIKKVGKYALAVFGVRSAYMAIRNAMNIISQNDDQLKADIDYIKNALAYTLEPIVRGIVNLIKQMLIYVGYIIKAWTGKNIFENANKSLKNANSSAQKLSKTLAGFDEINVVGSNGTAGGTTTSSFDLGSPEDVDVPKWIKWIADNGEFIARVLTGIAGGLLAIYAGASLVQGLGIFLILDGIVGLIQSILNYLKDPTWENFKNILVSIGIIAGGVFLIFGGVPALITLIVGAVVALGLAIYKNWEKIKGWFSNIGGWINEKFIKPIKDKFNSLPNWMKTLIKGMVNTAITVLNSLIGGLNAMLLPLRAIITVIGKVMGKNWTLETISIPKIPKLAKGGIVNMPSRGVPVGGAIAGERGQEGVIPLTDSQQMALLGEAIGKYITINATVVNSMNGRVLSREIQKIQNQGNFAMNR